MSRRDQPLYLAKLVLFATALGVVALALHLIFGKGVSP
jgi:hypothetical protein